MAQMLDPDAIFATAEPTRRSGRALRRRSTGAESGGWWLRRLVFLRHGRAGCGGSGRALFCG